jgi:uncharacterized protein YaiI (UPF0178 family)
MEKPPEPAIYLDADACPVKEQVYRVAERYDMPLWVVANTPMRLPERAGLRAKLVVVPGTPDAADKWISETARRGDLVLTADIPLAARAIEAGARCLDFRGGEFTAASIGNALAAREVNAYLRSIGAPASGPPALSSRDRGRFASLLDNVVSAMTRSRANRQSRP